MDRGRRPKPLNVAYNQGDGVLRFEVVSKPDGERLRLTLRETRLDGKMVSVELDEHELTVTLQKLFDTLINLQARRR